MRRVYYNGRIILTNTSLTINAFFGGHATINRDQIRLINYAGDSTLFRNLLRYPIGILNLLLLFNIYLGIMQLRGFIKAVITLRNGDNIVFYIPGNEIDDFKTNI
jgi:hypothetical protein